MTPGEFDALRTYLRQEFLRPAMSQLSNPLLPGNLRSDPSALLNALGQNYQWSMMGDLPVLLSYMEAQNPEPISGSPAVLLSKAFRRPDLDVSSLRETLLSENELRSELKERPVYFVTRKESNPAIPSYLQNVPEHTILNPTLSREEMETLLGKSSEKIATKTFLQEGSKGAPLETKLRFRRIAPHILLLLLGLAAAMKSRGEKESS